MDYKAGSLRDLAVVVELKVELLEHFAERIDKRTPTTINLITSRFGNVIDAPEQNP